MPCNGEPIKGILNSSDASSGVVVPIFNQGSLTARTLADNEYIVIRELSVVTEAGGDTHVFAGADATPGTGETIKRGNFSANGGIQTEALEFAGRVGHNVYVVSPAGQCDVEFTGSIHEKDDGVRPSWREAESPPTA